MSVNRKAAPPHGNASAQRRPPSPRRRCAWGSRGLAGSARSTRGRSRFIDVLSALCRLGTPRRQEAAACWRATARSVSWC